VPDRYIATEVVELGMESTPGTAVPTTVRLQGVSVELDTSLEVDQFGPAGLLWNSIAAPRQ
jgi:hypothetical protein